MSQRQIYVPLTGCAWEPTDDPKWYRQVEPCGPDCHHPVHAFNRGERRQHIEEASWLLANVGPEEVNHG